MNRKYMLKILNWGFKNAWSSQMWHTDDGDMRITIIISNERYDISEERAREMWPYFRDYKKRMKKDFKQLKRRIKEVQRWKPYELENMQKVMEDKQHGNGEQ